LEKGQGHRASALKSEGRCRDADAIGSHPRMIQKGKKKQDMKNSMHCDF